MTSYRAQLHDDLRRQAEFAAGYSPLYARLFGILADWLAANDPLMKWLVDVVRDRAPFDVTLLLPAGLHWAILAGQPGVAKLAAFYPTAGGTADFDTPAFAAALAAAIRDQRHALESFMLRATVQTNETARGLAWLWPLAQTGWSEAHLLELGASAGLNLLADRRAYRLLDGNDGATPPLTLGAGVPEQFTVIGHGASYTRGAGAALPRILSRSGVDVAPFHLRTAADELTLASFLWGDQPVRLQRLREGIAALRTAEAAGDAPQLVPLSLPDDLPSYLERWAPSDDTPLMVYNTTVTMYIDGGGDGLRAALDPWARAQSRPVIWVQWEPGDVAAGKPPADGWLAWTADVWQDSQHRHVHLAWVHPHAAGLMWLPGAGEWLAYPP